MVLQGSQRHKLVNKEALIPVSTVADQIDKVWVVQKAKHKNLHQKFSISLQSIPVKLFHCNYLEQIMPKQRHHHGQDETEPSM